MHGARLGLYVAEIVGMPDIGLVARKLPEREPEDIDTIITDHSVVIQDTNIPERFHEAAHFLDGGLQIGQLITFISTTGSEELETSWNPENSVPVLGAPFQEWAEIGMIQGSNISEEGQNRSRARIQ